MTQKGPRPQQGPEWLADWLLTPPDWLRLVVLGLGLVVALGALARLRRRGWRVSDGQQSLMLITAGSALGVMTAVSVFKTYVALPFAADVGLGLALGWLGANAWSFEWVAQAAVPEAWDVRQRYLAGWLGVFVVALLGPVVGVSGPVVDLALGYLLILAGVMLVYNYNRYQGDDFH